MDRHTILGSVRLSARAIDELMGLCKGIMADGALSRAEILALRRWMRENPIAANVPLVKPVCDLLREVLEDGQVSAAEESRLVEMVMSLIGGHDPDGNALPTTLPLTKPKPKVVFEGKWFCLTGQFDTGHRKHCEEITEARGGRCARSVTLQTDYLVIGEKVSGSWKHSSAGSKILRALEIRLQREQYEHNKKKDVKRGPVLPYVVSEDDWYKAGEFWRLESGSV
jgi:hypothetical protein